MKSKILTWLVWTSAVTILCSQLVAHHGTGVSYDASKPVTFKAVVTEFHYANPHPQLFFDVTDEKGNVVHWSGEFYPNSKSVGSGRLGEEAIGGGAGSRNANHDNIGALPGGRAGGGHSQTAKR